MNRQLERLSENGVRAVAGLFVTRGLILVLGTLAFLAMAYMLEKPQLGVVVHAWALVLVFAAIVSVGGHQFLLREFSATRGNLTHGVSVALAARVTLFYPLVLGAVLLLLIETAPESASVLTRLSQPDSLRAIVVAALTLNLFPHLSNYLRVLSNQNSAMALSDAMPQVLLAISSLLVLSYDSFSVPNVMFTFSAISLGVLLAVFVWVLFRLKPSQLFRRSENWTRFSPAFWVNTMLTSLTSQLDIVIGGLFLSPVALGEYQILKRLINLIGQAKIVANWLIAVDAGASFAGSDYKALNRVARRGAEMGGLLAIILLIAVTAVTVPIFNIYNIDPSADIVAAFALLLMGVVASVWYGANFIVAAQCGMEMVNVRARVLGVIASLTALAALAVYPRASILALSFLVAQIAMNTYVWSMVKLNLNVDTSIWR